MSLKIHFISFNINMNDMDQPWSTCIPNLMGYWNIYWLVVYLPFWKIWVRQLGWVFPIYGKIEFMFQTTNQMNIEPAMDLGYLPMNQGDPRTHGTTASCNVHDSQLLVFHINQWKPTLHQIGQTPNFLGSPYWHIPHVSWVRQPPIGWQQKKHPPASKLYNWGW